LALALREFSGDWWLDGLARALEWQVPPLARHTVRVLGRVNARRAEATLARLRRDELLSWGRPNLAGPRRLSGPLWRRLEVLDAELGVVAQMLPNGDRLLTYHGVVVAERWWGAAKKRRGRPPKQDASALEEMDRIFQADPTLSLRDRRRIAERLIDDGWLHDPSVDRESLIRRLVRHFPCKKITD
jgi:hypothetical protein